MILPSNGSPLTRPENTASAYITDFSTPIILDDNWEVALTEYSFEYIEKSMFAYITTYSGTHEEHIINIINDQGTLKISDNVANIIGDNLPVNNAKFSLIDNILLFSGDVEFHTIIETNNESKYVERPTYNNGNYSLSLDLIKTYGNHNKYYIAIYTAPSSSSTKMFKEFPYFNEPSEIINYINKSSPNIFETLAIELNNKVSLKILPAFSTAEISKELAKMLGFEQNIFDSKTHIAKNIPKIKSRYNQVYIYASIIDPILVGGVHVPLLKSVWIDSKYRNGDIVNGIMKKPMYLPTSLNMISNVEVNIRSDSGELIPFPYGSKSSLTLHFRQN